MRKDLALGIGLARKEQLTVTECIWLCALPGADVGFADKMKGSLELSKLADLILLGCESLSVPRAQLKYVQVRSRPR